MIDISKREMEVIKVMLCEIAHGSKFCISSELCGHDLSDFETQLIVDVLSEYVEGE